VTIALPALHSRQTRLPAYREGCDPPQAGLNEAASGAGGALRFIDDLQDLGVHHVIFDISQDPRPRPYDRFTRVIDHAYGR
jgi:hypothetical protein